MRLPHTISAYAFEAFRCSEETLNLPCEQHRTLRSENEEWDRIGIPPDLKTQALRVIAENWRKNPTLDNLPTCADRDYLLEILPLDIEFDLAIKNIHYDHYWRRAAEARWKVNDPSDHGDSWRRLYCERHLWEYLESLDPTYFEPQKKKCENLLDLVHEHVHVLKIRQLIPAKPPLIPRLSEVEEDPPRLLTEEPEINHLPMNLVLEKLPNLREIYINIGVIYMKENFDLRDFEFSVEDSRNIGQGTKELGFLKKFSLTRSNLTQPRAAAILQGLAINNSIQEIDFSYCKLGDEGALTVGAFLSYRSVEGRFKRLSLCNNGIGPRGLSGIVRSLILCDTKLSSIESLDMRFNPIGDEGAGHLAALFLRYFGLEHLNISCCSIGPDGGMKMAEVLASGHSKFSNFQLDCSNNPLGVIVGEAFEVMVKSCTAISEMDVRMCGFSKESEISITESVDRNRMNLKEWLKNKSLSLDDERMRAKSIHPPSKFALFQEPHPYIRLKMDDENQDNQENEEDEEEENSHQPMENENEV